MNSNVLYEFRESSAIFLHRDVILKKKKKLQL